MAVTEERTSATDPRVSVPVDAIIAAHGDRLDEGQREILSQQVERLRGAAAQLDGYHLENADEPDFAFQAIERVDSV